MQQGKSIMQIIRIQELNRQIIIYALEWCGDVNGGGGDGGGGVVWRWWLCDGGWLVEIKLNTLLTKISKNKKRQKKRNGKYVCI